MCPTTRVEGRVKSEREGGKGKAGNAINRTFIRMISFRYLSKFIVYIFNLGPVEAPEMYSKLICGGEQLPKRCVLAVPPRLASEGYRFVQDPRAISMRCANQAAEPGLSRSELVHVLLPLGRGLRRPCSPSSFGRSLGRSLGTFGFSLLLVVLLGPVRARIPFGGLRLSGISATPHTTTQHG